MERNGKNLCWVDAGDLLVAPPFPPRPAAEAVGELLLSSVRIHGILSPVLVRPGPEGLQVICGYRRLLAARKAGVAEVPVLVLELDDVQAARCYLSENLCRRELGTEEREAALKLLRRLRDEEPTQEGLPPGSSEEALPEVPQEPAARLQAPQGARAGRMGRARRPSVDLLLGRTSALLAQVRAAKQIEPGAAREIALDLLELPEGFLPFEPQELYSRSPSDALAAHSLLVASMNLLLARDGAGREERLEQALAGLLHDVGMVFLGRLDLERGSALSTSQRLDVQSHTRLGHAIILGGGSSLAAVALSARDHHERQDGSGYPSGLRGDEISLLARVTALADSYASLISPRPHRDALSPEAALDRLHQATELGRYDPPLFSRLQEACQRRGIVVGGPVDKRRCALHGFRREKPLFRENSIATRRGSATMPNERST
jgi:HD-GYP domain-containing protein (c-di-GMP phosphodiesterase class II)